MSVRRWVFTDPVTTETYVFERNPREMTSPYLPRGTKAGPVPLDGRARAVRNRALPREWSFGGDIRTQTHYEALLAWADKPNRVHLTDHLDRTWDVLPTQLDVNEQRPTPRTPWRFTYTMRAYLYGEVA